MFFGFHNVENLNSAGQVTINSGPTWLWTGGFHPGTLTGAFVLIGIAWWVNTAGLRWWRSGRAVAYGVLVIPGLVLTLVTAAGLVYLTSSFAVGIAAVVPDSLGGSSRLAVNPIAAIVVGALMAAVALAVRGRGRGSARSSDRVQGQAETSLPA